MACVGFSCHMRDGKTSTLSCARSLNVPVCVCGIWHVFEGVALLPWAMPQNCIVVAHYRNHPKGQHLVQLRGVARRIANTGFVSLYIEVESGCAVHVFVDELIRLRSRQM